MKPRELIRESELEQWWKNYKPEPITKPMITYHTITKKPRQPPQIKRWQMPEELLELKKTITGADPKRFERLLIKHPIEGISAATQQLQSLKDRMIVFVRRVVDSDTIRASQPVAATLLFTKTAICYRFFPSTSSSK